jgi:hypothetical protein
MWKVMALASILMITGCAKFGISERYLKGTYEAKTNNWTLSLQLQANKTFLETIRHRDGFVESASGSWSLQDHCANVSNFLLPVGSVPDSIFSAEIGSKEKPIAVKTPEGSYRFDWCLSVEPSLVGDARLYINPDIDIALIKSAS